MSESEARDLAAGKTPPKDVIVAEKTPDANDFIMKGELDEGERMVLSNYGSILRSTLVNSEDMVLGMGRDEQAKNSSASPSTSTAASPPARPPVPAFADAVRASLTGVGTSLRIELDVGQLTELVLRDIMMNKSNVFGGIG